MAATHGSGGSAPAPHTRWARFGKIPVGYKTVWKVVNPAGKVFFLNHPVGNATRVRAVRYRAGGWVKVGSPQFKKITSYIGEHGHQAAIPMQYKIGKINPAQRPGANPTPITQKTTKAMVQQIVATGKTPAQARQQLGISSGGGGGGVRAGGAKPGKVAARNATILGRQLGGPQVGKMQGKGAATAQANLQFGSQISDAKTNIADQSAQGKQDLQDIANWYTQIAGVNKAGQAANQQAVSGATAAANAATAHVLAAIGGQANVGAGAVGAAGNDNAAMMQAIGAGQDQYQNNLNTALAQNQAGQMGAQTAVNSQAAQQLQQSLSDLQGQRSSAIQANLASILQQNNALAETRFNNNIAKQQEVQAAVSLLGNQRLQGAQIKAQNIANRAASGAGAGGGKSGFVPWGKLTANDKYGLVQQLLVAPANGSKLTYQMALHRATTLGYNPSNVAPYLGSYFGAH